MALLSQLLSVPELQLSLIQSGPKDPEISWVSTTELLDLSEYLEGGEIILTTGLALGSDDARWRDFVASLSRARVAAIGFGVGVNHDRIPAPLIQAASSYRVALFQIPLPVPFIAVSKAAAELLRFDELRVAREALQAQQRLLAGARGSQDPAEVLASIAQATGRQLALLGSDGSSLASTAGFAAARDADGAELVSLDEAGRLRLAVAGSAPLTAEGRSIITAGSMVLGLGLRDDSAEETRERERWERLTTGLLSGTETPESLAILAPSLRMPERVRAIAVQGTAEDVAEWRRRPRSGLDRLIAPGAEEARALGLSSAWQLCADVPETLDRALEAASAHGLDAVVGRSAAATEAVLSRRSASARLESLSPTAPLYTAPRVPDVVWADRSAPLLEALLDVGDQHNTLSADVLGPLSLQPAGARASASAPDLADAGPGARTEAGSSTAPLSEPDRRLLRDTLRAVFLADGQRGPAAAALGIHRNTLRDRITRIERLTGRSLADADDRAELWFALRIEQLRLG